MTQTFSQDVKIDGVADSVQLTVQGAANQVKPLQTWETPDGSNVLAQVTKDGRLQVGEFGLSTADALIEAGSSPLTNAQRGLNASGEISSSVALTSPVNWSVHELKVSGTGGISTLETALRAKITGNSNGALTNAELRAADVEAMNQAGVTNTGKFVGLRSTARNAAGKTVNTLTGIEVAIVNEGTVSNAVGVEVIPPTGMSNNLTALKIPDLGSANYAIKTGTGKVEFGDTLTLNGLKLAANAGSGKVLTSDTAGVASWQTPIVNVVDNTVCGGRLTLNSGAPVSDVVEGSTLHFIPFRGNRVALYTAGAWKPYTFTALQQDLTILTANANYDIFLYDNAGTLTLEAVAWANDTTRATGIVLFDGVYVKVGDGATRRYLGSVRTKANAQSQTRSEDSAEKRFVFNYYNRVHRKMLNSGYAGHSYAAEAWRKWNNDANLRLQWLVGVVEDSAPMSITAWITSTGGTAQAAFGHNSETNASMGFMGVSGAFVLGAGYEAVFPALGINYVQALEYGHLGSPAPYYSGIRLSGEVLT